MKSSRAILTAIALITGIFGVVGQEDIRQRIATALGDGRSRVQFPSVSARPTMPPADMADLTASLRAAMGRVRAASANASAARSGLIAPALATPGVELYLRGNGTVRMLRAPEFRPATARGLQSWQGSSPVQKALAFVTENRSLFRLDNPAGELAASPPDTDELGRQRVVLRQVHRGIPLWPATLAAHFDAAGRLQSLTGEYVPTPASVEVTPKWSATQAVARANERLAGGRNTTNTDPELIVYAPLDGEPRLAWKFDLIESFVRAWRVVVAADDGRLLHRGTLVHDAGVAGQGVDLTGATRLLNVWQQGNTYYLLDASKPSFNPASDPLQDPRGVITILDARNQPPENFNNNLFYITSASASAWTVPDGVSASFNFSLTYDYYWDRHGRNSLDGNGGNILAIVRGAFDNAFWSGAQGVMVFGNVKPYAASLDVVAHELSHGTTEKTANLIYENQSGALNEAFSDIFGEMVEGRARGQNDWLMGSELNAPIRNMKTPAVLQWSPGRPYPSRMSQFVQLPNTAEGDHGGVHINSSIINQSFYLLAEGLPGAIGATDSARIFYRALTRHLQPQSQFVDARLAAVLSAEELFGAGSAQARRTAEAFDGVEILAAPSTPEPTPVPTVPGDDANLHVYEVSDIFGSTYDLYRREDALGDGADGRRLARSIKLSRPAVSGDGQLVVYVTEDHDLCVAATADPAQFECLGFAGRVHSVAISPDGHWVALVLRDPTAEAPLNQIELVDLIGTNNKSFGLVAPTTEGAALDQILHADSMTFTTDSSELVYDALSQVRFATGGATALWSIFSLNVASGTTTIIVPPIEGIDTGNPSLGRAGSRYLAFDAQSEANGNNVVFVLDLFAGKVAGIATTGDDLAYPAFTGDESALAFAVDTGNIFAPSFSVFKQPLTADRLGRVGDPTVYQSDARLAVIYRRGAFQGTNALPSVSLSVTPTNPVAPANLVLRATASDPGGSVAKVEFYSGSQKVGETTTATAGNYDFTWNAVAVGQYRLTARAIDNLGGAADSTGVNVSVRDPGAGGPVSLSASRLANGTIRLRVSGPAGDYVVQQSENLNAWGDFQSVTVTAGGHATVDDTRGTQNHAALFYRVKKP